MTTMNKFWEKYKPKYLFLTFLLFAALVVWSAVFAYEVRTLKVAFLDVGQGDAIFIETPTGVQVLIDGGPNKSVLAELSRVMPFFDRSLDAVILTHPHLDHVGGLVEVLKRYEIKYALESGAESPTAEFEEWEKLIEAKGIGRILAKRGLRFWLDDKAYLDFLLPAELVSRADPHENMVVGRLNYGQTCFIFTGDMERELEWQIIDDGIDCEVLKVGHHGSKTSTSDAFLAAVSPEIAVIQVGAKNRYGHPYSAVLDKLQASAVKVFRTDTDGAIILESDGKEISAGQNSL